MTALAPAQTSTSEDSSGALRKLQAAQEAEDSIPPELRALIINKPKIAEDTLQRVVGLREAGNPHIQTGEGLLLPGMMDVPELSRVDVEKLREERIAIYERKLEKLSTPREARDKPAQGPSTESLTSAPESLKPTKGYGGLLLALSLLLAGAAAGLFLFQKNQNA